MIPKKIHFCWLSEDEMPLQTQKCINSWKEKMPDYEIIRWDRNKFSIESVPFVNKAYSTKKWAFASDYIRLYALYNEGGIYLDSDVLVKKPFDKFLNYYFFTSVEYHPSIVENKKTQLYLRENGTRKYPSAPIKGIGIQAAVLGAIQGHPFLKDCMDYYNNHFIPGSRLFNDEIIAPGIYAITAEKYGFRYTDKLQHLREKMLILPSNIFASTPSLADSESFAIHFCAGSWKDSEPKKFINKLKSKNFLRTIFRKPLLNKDLN